MTQEFGRSARQQIWQRKCIGSGAQKLSARDNRDAAMRFSPGHEVQFHRPRRSTQARAKAFRARRSRIRHVFGGIDSELSEACRWIVFLVLVCRLQHPRKHSTVSSAGGTPTAWGVEGKMLRIEFRK